MDIDQLRREYLQGGLHRKDLTPCPITQFELWLQQAIKAQINDPTAMVAATTAADGQPSQRIVLLKHVDNKGFVFYTNLSSRKAQELTENPKISLLFPWHAMERQVKICGVAQSVTTAEALKYFLSRPKESQLAAWASAQSRPIRSRQMLLQQFNAIKRKFQDQSIPLPDFWGGYRVVPHQIEFWQGGANRLHDRFQYTLDDDQQWRIARLAP